uniref:Uncharacterized protein n=1 Tax=Faecalibaculum rodentium TaxID=1702221 RepID=A0A140DTS1_9FIRM|nr:hypothetical protein AALO17_09140 [Faecalibaculum rodentium]
MQQETRWIPVEYTSCISYQNQGQSAGQGIPGITAGRQRRVAALFPVVYNEKAF